jgi:hypothetical protein
LQRLKSVHDEKRKAQAESDTIRRQHTDDAQVAIVEDYRGSDNTSAADAATQSQPLALSTSTQRVEADLAKTISALQKQLEALEVKFCESEQQRENAEARAIESERQRRAAEERMRAAEDKAIKSLARAQGSAERIDELETRVVALDELNTIQQTELVQLRQIVADARAEHELREREAANIIIEHEVDSDGEQPTVTMLNQTYYSYDNAEEL